MGTRRVPGDAPVFFPSGREHEHLDCALLSSGRTRPDVELVRLPVERAGLAAGSLQGRKRLKGLRVLHGESLDKVATRRVDVSRLEIDRHSVAGVPDVGRAGDL